MTTAQFWHRLQELLRLCFKKTSSTEKMSRDLRAALFPGSGAVDFDALKTKMESTATRLRDLYESLIGTPACNQPLTKEILDP